VTERAQWRKAIQRLSIQLGTAAQLGDTGADGGDLDSGSVARVAAVACSGGRGVGAVPAAPVSEKAMRRTRRRFLLMDGNHTHPRSLRAV
jgi:hypothetical protein